MSDPIDHGQTRHHNLGDWLDLHALDPTTCLRIIDAIRCEATAIPADCEKQSVRYQAPDTDGTWAITIAAMKDFLPDHHAFIEETFLKSEKIAVVRSKKSRRALTIDHGPSKYPTIVYSVTGDPSDQLMVAHEFGHALQIRASGGQFVPPVMREVCAFLAEAALMSYGLNHDARLHAALLARWSKDNRRYFGQLTKNLADSLVNTQAVYEYGWNYPIARLVALRISTRFSQNSVWDVFKGHWSVSSVLKELGI